MCLVPTPWAGWMGGFIERLSKLQIMEEGILQRVPLPINKRIEAVWQKLQMYIPCGERKGAKQLFHEA